jgi:uncharacterized membrane protein
MLGIDALERRQGGSTGNVGVSGAPRDSVAAMRLVRALAGPFFVFAGAMHFAVPRAYARIMPPYLPRHRELVYASGVAEAIGGLGLMPRATRRVAGWWLIATLIAIFPANVHMALRSEDFPEVPGGAVSLWARLPFQAVFIAGVRAAMRG